MFGRVNVGPYRDSTQPTLDPWAALMRRRRWGFVGIALMVGGASFVFAANRLVGLVPAVLGFALITYGEWGKCPHCGKKFARRGAYHNSFTRTCLNCGVELGTPKTSA